MFVNFKLYAYNLNIINHITYSILLSKGLGVAVIHRRYLKWTYKSVRYDFNS